MTTYPFNQFRVKITDPTGSSFPLGTNAEENITMEEPPRSSQQIGPDGSAMTSVYADKSGTATVRLRNASPVNSQLEALYDQQKRDSTQYGQNTITISDMDSNVLMTCTGAAFASLPMSQGNLNRWRFHVAFIDHVTPT
jgi:hypothetical protein